nr:50S ribosomal protein L32e [Candidatus Woesearchaeota archaeon]
MTDIKRLLKIREKIKSRKPKYLRQDAHRVKKLDKKWRRPRGMHSKMRKRLKSYRRNPEIGYGSPKEVKYLNKEGLMPVLIKSKKDIESANENNILIISRTIGLKKKLEILRQVKGRGLKVENIDVDKFIEENEKMLKQRKEGKKKIGVKKEEVKAKVEEKKDHKDEEKKVKKSVLEGKDAGRVK